ncbi:hypothetical protein AALP_AA4G006000 [Arabis alpina]|uniref:Uncharacterized protein n=1 Tax=Arabis alpina TaxID=50452 RepID=A0A087H0A4_ARAAL|nr:hypothetical protein AALP_AA4G006000 [Arabis alpina]
MDFAEEVSVFVDTNLGTRIAMTVPMNITSRDFKRKLEETHTSCLPSLGEIRVRGLMVKRKSRFYYLAESMPIRYVFRDNQKPWFIHAEARLVNISQEPSVSTSIDKVQIRHCVGENKKVKKSRNKPIPKHVSRNLASGDASLDKREFLGPSTSEPETVIRSSPLLVPRVATEMINSDCLIPKTPERKPGDSASKSDMVRKKLTVAANNIRMQGKSHLSSSLSSSIFQSRKKSLDGKTITSLAKFLVFEIPDTED